MPSAPLPTILAIDFETADAGADSACAIGLARVEGGRVVARASRLIRPPRPRILFTWLHGIAWEHVKGEPAFGPVWHDIRDMAEGVDYLAAHNASFDRRVLAACCEAAGLDAPALPWLCTVKLARAAWAIRPTKLPDVCARLGIDLLRHHDAGSDAEACAEIAAHAVRGGHDLASGVLGAPMRRGLRSAGPAPAGTAP